MGVSLYLFLPASMEAHPPRKLAEVNAHAPPLPANNRYPRTTAQSWVFSCFQSLDFQQMSWLYLCKTTARQNAQVTPQAGEALRVPTLARCAALLHSE
jgi:hypothetical protein